ncbi:MAG: hypothetical protein HOH43_02185 [Candidatus Latescibacteria bacterium]|jgi:5-phospho-D-xylono-1,4-lactonase|nr:hypothetical protein [Candidatus Latescibacterota bacterium]
MATVMTLNGEVRGEDLGVVDYHEHLAFDAPEWLLKEDPDFALNNPEKSAEELTTFVHAGGRTIIDMTAIDFGRNIAKMQRVGELVPQAHIIAITGYNKPYFCDPSVFETPDADLIKDCISDIVDGIDGTSVRAAIVKGGSGYNTMNQQDRKLLRVAAKVHLETGVPIITHTEGGTMGFEQVEYLVSHGVKPERICLSHMDRNPDFWEHRRITQSGAYVGYDCPGKTKYGPDEYRNSVLRKMIDEGQGNRILLGNDLGRPSYWRSYGGGPGLDFVLTKYIPRLKAELFNHAAIDDLLINNPRRFLTGE